MRRFSRIALNFPATLKIDGVGTYDIHELSNLSIGGCLVRLEDNIAEGTQCTMTITLVGGLGSTPVQIAGKVVRHDQDYIAIRFTGISPEDLHHLQNLIRYNAPDPDQIEKEIKEHPGLV